MVRQLARLSILFAVAFFLFMKVLCGMAITVALPTIAHQMHTPLGVLQWIVLAKLIAASIGCIFSGRTADHYGAKKISCIAVVIILIGASISGLAPSGWVIAAGQSIQGFGAGLAGPAILIIMCSQFSDEKREYAIGIIIVSMALGSMTYPYLGGLITDTLGWRWIFSINVLGTITFLALILFSYKNNILKKTIRKTNYTGLSFYFIAVILVVYSTTSMQSHPIPWLRLSITLICGFVLLTLSYRIERNNKNPLVSFHLLKIKQYRDNLIIHSLVIVPVFAYLFLMPFIYEGVYHLSSYQSGLNLSSFTIGYGIFSFFSAMITRVLGYHKCIRTGCYLSAASSLIILFFVNENGYLWVDAAMFLTGVGGAMFFTPITARLISSVKKEQMGQATGMQQSVVSALVAPLIIAITGIIIILAVSIHVISGLRATGEWLSPAQYTVISKSLSGVLHLRPLKSHFTAPQVSIIQSNYHSGMLFAFHLLALLSLLATIVCIIRITIDQRKNRLNDSRPEQTTSL